MNAALPTPQHVHVDEADAEAAKARERETKAAVAEVAKQELQQRRDGRRYHTVSSLHPPRTEW